MINGAARSLRWSSRTCSAKLDIDPRGHGVPLFPSERKSIDGTGRRATADLFRRALAEAVDQHLSTWSGKLTPDVLRHFCASQLYLAGMNLFAIQELRRSGAGTKSIAAKAVPHSPPTGGARTGNRSRPAGSIRH
ncbi:hypothetical protein [Nocardia terpenica]|uniref:hypothetical protein n=1 Tax=Nocardia terpenica TaxID=455432 RepID=UPI001EEB7C8A|nr:hypothetical protein [Nocardia terpenica]